MVCCCHFWFAWWDAVFCLKLGQPVGYEILFLGCRRLPLVLSGKRWREHFRFFAKADTNVLPDSQGALCWHDLHRRLGSVLQKLCRKSDSFKGEHCHWRCRLLTSVPATIKHMSKYKPKCWKQKSGQLSFASLGVFFGMLQKGTSGGGSPLAFPYCSVIIWWFGTWDRTGREFQIWLSFCTVLFNYCMIQQRIMAQRPWMRHWTKSPESSEKISPTVRSQLWHECFSPASGNFLGAEAARY